MINPPVIRGVSRLTLYPIKSLDGVEVTQVAVTDGGAIAHDREFALLGEGGRLLRGKETPELHRIRARFDLDGRTVTVSHPAEARESRFSLDHERDALARWLSLVLGQPVRILHLERTGLPDDPNLFGPTLIATPTLAAVASWFTGIGEFEMRRRLRTNVELDADDPFAEDALAGEPGSVVVMSIGGVQLEGVSLCSRCEVPARDSDTGVQDGQFARTFAERRRDATPAWSVLHRLQHAYQLCVRTRIAPGQAGKRIRVGDTVRRLGTRALADEPRRFAKLRDRVAELVAGGA